MKKALVALFAVALAVPASVFAADAKILSVTESVEIKAPADKVWATVGNFGDLGAWHPAVKKTDIVGGKNNVKGALRLLTLGDGATIKEELLGYSASAKTLKYKILEGALPVSSYVSSITVKTGKDGATTVVWKGNFKRADISATPAAGKDDDTALKTMHAVYRGGLDNLKKISE